MSTNDSLEDRLQVLARVWTDALTYALAVAVTAGVVAIVLAITTGGGLVRAKHLLFLGGWVVLAYATVRLWPSSPDDVEAEPTGQYSESLPPAHDSTRFQRFVAALPPRRWLQAPPPDRRLSLSAKLVLSGISILLLSYLMESVFGIA